MEAKVQAPIGGCYSELNHEWYQGGQFLPDTCLPKGVARKVKKAAQIPLNIAELVVCGCVVSVRYAGEAASKFLFSGVSRDEARMFAEALIKEKHDWYIASGFAPHPTELSITQ